MAEAIAAKSGRPPSGASSPCRAATSTIPVIVTRSRIPRAACRSRAALPGRPSIWSSRRRRPGNNRLVSPAPLRLSVALERRLFEASAARRWGLTVADLRAAVEESVCKAFGDKTPSPFDVERFAGGLHIEDLALARACAAGSEPAWEHFIAAHRPGLYRAADAIDPSGGARDVADAIFAELFGLRERDGVRQSLFRYFHGRSSLSTWLRAVLSQRHVDRVRERRRLDPLPEDDAVPDGAAAGRGDREAPDPERARFVEAMRDALGRAIAALPPRDRLRLTCYYTREMKLAAIGRLLGEHEASVSRHLTRIRGEIRDAVGRKLRDDHRMDDHAAAECVRTVLDDAGDLDVAELIGASPGAPSGGKDRPRNRSR